jgi:ribosomal protein L37E
MMLLAIAQVAQSGPVQEDFDPGVGLFVLGLFAFVVCLMFAGAALAGGVAGAAAVTAVMMAVFVVIAGVATALVVNLMLAMVVWTRRPRGRVLVHKRWWGLATLVMGPVSAGAFGVLHYGPWTRARCYRCGYDRAGMRLTERCPECGMPSAETGRRVVLAGRPR